MKKIYLLLLLCCVSCSLFAQSTVVTIYATGTTGTYITGSSTTTTRTDGNVVSSSTSAGYAVFDLSIIPAGCVIQAVTPGFYTTTYTGSGSPSACNTYAYPGDLSTVTLAGTLYSDMTSTTGGSTLISTAAYTAGVGNNAITSTPAGVAFIQANVGSKVSIAVSGGGTRVLTMTGETGNTTSITTVGHAPYLQISYCLTPTLATASAAPTTLCAGDMLTLTGSATNASNYVWSGPASYTSTNATSTLTTTVASSGVYTLTAINACGTFSTTMTATTAPVVVNPLPNPITGVSSICTGNASTLGETTFSGTWISDNPGAVSVIPSSGLITGNGAGVANITYELSTGCQVTKVITDNNSPTAISGPSSASVCSGSIVTLTDGVSGGTWTETNLTGTATINPSTGDISGGTTAGTVSITYTTAGCLPVTYGMSVDPVPAAFSGSALLCSNTTTTLVETTTGGTWYSSSSSTALVGSTGIVTGESAGTANIDYILPSGCMASELVLVFNQPSPIVSPGHVCNGAGSTLTDPTTGGMFSPATGTYATINPATGAVTGTAVGVQTFTYTITYTTPTFHTCAVTTDVTINAAPAAIAGPTQLCDGAAITYTDADAGSWFTTTPLTATVDITSGTLTALSAGAANIILVNAAFCSTTLDVTVNSLPVSVITPVGPTTFCSGGSVVLNASTGAGLTYQWDEGGTAIPGASTSSYTASTTANFDVEITDANGCEATSVPTTVTAGIDPVIVYTTSPSFCIGNYIVLNINTGTASGTIFYQWKLNGVAIPGAAADNFAANAPGIYTADVSITGGSGTCIATTATPVTVVVNPTPTPVISSSGHTLLTGTYADYQWFVNTTAIAGANSATYTPPTTGSYRVEVTDANGCVGFSGAFLVDNVGVAIVNQQDISLYPNPATNVLHIQSPATVRVVISSVEGKLIIDQANAKDIELGNLASGLYLITIYDGNGTRILVNKLVKE